MRPMVVHTLQVGSFNRPDALSACPKPAAYGKTGTSPIFTATVIAPYTAVMTETAPVSSCAYTDAADVQAVYSRISYIDAYSVNDDKGDTTGGVAAPSPNLMTASLAITAKVLFETEATFTGHNIVFLHSGRVCDDLKPHLQRLMKAGRAVDVTERLDELSPLLTGRRYAAHISNGGAWFVTSPSGTAQYILLLTEHPSDLLQVSSILQSCSFAVNE